MSKIEKVPKKIAGFHDAVEMMCNCSVVCLGEKDGKYGIVGKPEIHECRAMASYESGTLTLSDHATGRTISILIGEVMALLRAASEAAIEANGEKGANDVKKDAAQKG